LLALLKANESVRVKASEEYLGADAAGKVSMEDIAKKAFLQLSDPEDAPFAVPEDEDL
jgi:hypothetical protein